MITRLFRLFLCAALLTSAVPVRAQEEVGDAEAGYDLTPVGYCVGRELSAADLSPAGSFGAGQATEAGMDEAAAAKRRPAKPMSLSQRHATLSRVARLVEFYRTPGADATLKRTFSRVVEPSQLKFFSSRRRLLSTAYRTLAVIDYTYAAKQPGVCKAGAKARHDMLYAKDGLFIDPKTGTFSPWLEKLTGKKGGSVPAEAAYVEAGAPDEAGASFQDNYQRALEYQLKLSRRIDATADPKTKAELLCSRARGYRVLGLAALRQKPSDKAVQASGDLEASESESQASAFIDAGAEEPIAAGVDTEAGDPVTEAGWTQPASQPTLTANELYKKTGSSVVAIRSTSKPRGGMFGTGSVISDKGNGQILTNAHVVWNKAAGKPYETVTIYFKPAKITGDREADLQNGITATVVKLDRSKDLALLSLSRRPVVLRPVEFGDDTKVETGDPVFAIGHPEQGGLWTLTQGVVSAVKANLSGVKGKDAFQTDASINRGNSGGPLLDGAGRQIGVNSLIARRANDGLAITSVNFSLKIGFVKSWLAGPDTIEAGDDAAAEEGNTASAEEIGEDAGDGAILTVARPYSLDDAGESESVAASDDLSAAADETLVGEEQVAVESGSPDEAAAPEAKILTPERPYDANALIRQQMREIDDQGKEMSREIERRMKGRVGPAAATSATPAAVEVAYNEPTDAGDPEAAGNNEEASDLVDSGSSFQGAPRAMPPAPAIILRPSTPTRQPTAPDAKVVLGPIKAPPAAPTRPPKPPTGDIRPTPNAPNINKPGVALGNPDKGRSKPSNQPIVSGGCVNQGGRISPPKLLIAMKGDREKKKTPVAPGKKPEDKGKPEGLTPAPDRNPAQDIRLTPADIRRLKEQGANIHRIKGKQHTGQNDLFRDRAGNIYIKPRDGSGPGEPTGENLK